MVFQRVTNWMRKLTNLFYLSRMLSQTFYVALALLVLAFLFLLSFWIFPQWTCFDCQSAPKECSGEYQKALSENNILLCEKITTLKPHWEYDNYCREQCKAELGVRNNNPEQCEDIQRLRAGVELYPSLRDRCFTDIAAALNDRSLCQRAETSTARQECVKLK